MFQLHGKVHQVFLVLRAPFSFSFFQLFGNMFLKKGNEKFAVNFLFKDSCVLLTLVAGRDEGWVDKTRESRVVGKIVDSF